MRDISKTIVTVITAGLGLALAGCAGGAGTSSNPVDDAPVVDGKGETAEITPPSSDADGETPPATQLDASAGLRLVTTQAETVDGNDAWCGSMQLCWNNLMDETHSGNPIVFDDDAQNTEEVDHLNSKLFTTDDLSDDHYYTYVGPMTLDAKTEIETAISERFGQESDILDSLDGWGGPATQLLYAMIYRQFSFATPFAISDQTLGFGSKGNGNEATGVAYFKAETPEQREQVVPLYYEDASHNAVRIDTTGGDELILVRGPEGATLDEMWQSAMARAEEADASETAPLGKDETFVCPNLDIDLLRKDYDWVPGSFDGKKRIISEAVQTLKLHLDNEGGEVKSEAAIVVKDQSIPMGEDVIRHFNYTDTFAMFVRDGNAGDDAKPYVGVLVSDITQFQDGAERI